MTRPQLRYDCAPERLPVAPPGTAQRTAGSGLITVQSSGAPGKGSECSKDPFGSRSTPLYDHSFGCPLQHPTGFSNFQLDFGVVR
eukprot:scaffold1243_cov118-Isochrysis_galbana.AAC.3